MITTGKFRQELKKKMPGYKWTIHRQIADFFIDATGVQTSGKNRISTLEVTVKERNGDIEYCSKSYGYGLNSEWLGSCNGNTLSKSLRKLQDNYETLRDSYASHADALRNGRINKSSNKG